MDQVAYERPVGELFAELARETGTLVHQEVRLATTELTTKAKEAGKDAAMMGLGGMLAAVGSMLLLVGILLALGTLIPLWIAALLLGFVLAIAGVALVRKGMAALKTVNPVPERTLLTLQENKRWAKQELGR